MDEPHVTLRPDAHNEVEQRLHEPLEEQLTSALRAAAQRVRDQYAGEPVDEVYRRLLDETKAGLHPDIASGFTPDPDELRRVAEAITTDPS